MPTAFRSRHTLIAVVLALGLVVSSSPAQATGPGSPLGTEAVYSHTLVQDDPPLELAGETALTADGRVAAFGALQELDGGGVRYGVFTWSRDGDIHLLEEGANNPTASADGRLVALTTEDGTIALHDRVTGTRRVLTPALPIGFTGEVSSPSISPDGTHVVLLAHAGSRYDRPVEAVLVMVDLSDDSLTVVGDPGTPDHPQVADVADGGAVVVFPHFAYTGDKQIGENPPERYGRWTARRWTAGSGSPVTVTEMDPDGPASRSFMAPTVNRSGSAMASLARLSHGVDTITAVQTASGARSSVQALSDRSLYGPASVFLAADGDTVVYAAQRSGGPFQVWSTTLSTQGNQLVSAAWTGGESDGFSLPVGVADDGRTVALVSGSTNLVDGFVDVSPGDDLFIATAGDAPPPPPLQPLTAQATGPTRVALSWPAAAGTPTYQVWRGVGDGPLGQIGTTTQTSFTDTAATAQTTHSYQIRIAGTPHTTIASVTTPAPATRVPLDVIAARPDRVDLSWAAAPGAAEYTVRRGTSTGDMAPIGTTSGTTYRDTTVQESRTYVYAVDVAAPTPGPHTRNATVTTPALSQLTVTVVDGTVRLGWAAESGATSYQVLRGPSVDALAPLGSPTTSTSHEDSTVVPGSTMVYRVDIASPTAGRLTVAREVVVPDLSAPTVTITAPSVHGDYRPGSEATITVRVPEAQGATVTAVASVMDWFDGSTLRDAPSPEDVAVPLTSSGAGTWTGTLALRDGIAAVRTVVASVTRNGRTVTGETRGDDVAGTVEVALSGTPIESAALWAYSNDPYYGAQFDLARGDRSASFGPLPGGTPLTIVFSDSSNYQRQTVTARAGLALPAVITAPSYGSAHVVVRNHDGSPAPGVVVAAEIVGPHRRWLGSFTTAPDGTLDVTLLPTGEEVRFTAHDTGRARWQERVVSGTVTVDDAVADVELAFPALPTGQLSGTLLFEDGQAPPQASIHLQSYTADGPFDVTVTPAPDGSWTARLPVGEVSMLASTPPNGSASVRGLDLTAATPLHQDLVLPGARPHRVHVELRTRYAGDAVDTVQPLDWRVAVHFRLGLNDIQANSNTMYIQGRVGDPVRLCADGVEADLPPACAEGVLEADHDIAISLRLDQGAALSTRVVDHAGAPVADDVQVVLVQVTADDQRVLTDRWMRGGDIVVPVAEAGDYVLQVIPPDMEPQHVPVTVTADQIARGERIDIGTVEATRAAGPFVGTSSAVVALPDTVVPGQQLEIRAHVEPAPGPGLDGAVLEVPLPAGTALRGVTVDGAVVVTDPPVGGVLTVPLPSLRAGAPVVVRTLLGTDAVVGGDRLRSAPAVRSVEGTRFGLGSARVVVEGVQLDAPATSTTRVVTLTGLAPAGSQVALADGATIVGTATASPGGRFRATLELVDRGPRARHHLTASVPQSDGATLRTPVRTVAVDTTAPRLLEVAVQQPNGRRVTLDPALGVARFPYVFVPGLPIEVAMRFDDPERVRDARARIGAYSADAVLGDDGWFIASVPSDGRGQIAVDFDYVPGELTIADIPRPTDAEIELQARSALSATGGGYVVDPARTGEEDGVLRTALSWPELAAPAGGDGPLVTPDASFSMTLGPAVERTVTASDVELSRALGMDVVGYEMVVDEVSGAVRVEIGIPDDQLRAAGGPRAMRGASTAAFSGLTASQRIVVRTLAVEGTYLAATNTMDVFQAVTGADKYRDLDALVEELGRCGEPTISQNLGRITRVRALAVAKDVTALGVTTLGAVAAPATFGVGTIAVWGAGFALGTAMDLDYSYRYELLAAQIHALDCPPAPDDQPVPDNASGNGASGEDSWGTPVGAPEWIFDPSGYVFEGMPANRLQDVTATVWFGDSVEGPWHLWDADWYGQANPIPTDPRGRYAWDVPEGWWRVTYEKAGYTSAESESLRVLPPQLDVNEGLVSHHGPTVEDVTWADGTVRVDFSQPMQTALVTTDRIATSSAGVPVAGTLSPVGEEVVDGVGLAMTFVFTPDRVPAAGAVLRLEVDGALRSYHDRLLGDPVTRTVRVPARPGSGGSGSGGAGPDPDPGDGSLVIVPVGTDPADNSDTSIAFSRLAFPEGLARARSTGSPTLDEVLLASETVFADPLASASLQRERPLLLSDPDALEPEVLAEIQRLGATRVRILGGDHAVSTAVERALEQAGMEVARTAGPTRLETAAAIAQLTESAEGMLARAFPATDGQDATQAFADSLALGGWAAREGWPILLTETGRLSPAAAAELDGLARLNVVGGTAAVSAAVHEEALGRVGDVARVAGADRFGTAVEIARSRGFSTTSPATSVIIVEGQASNAWAAGFTAASLSAGMDAPILLVNGDRVPEATAAFLSGSVSPGARMVCAASTAACSAAVEMVG